MKMKVSHLAEFLGYSLADADVRIACVAPDGRVTVCDQPLFLAKGDKVYLVIDERDGAASRAAAEGELDLQQYDRPQVFGNRFQLVPKSR